MEKAKTKYFTINLENKEFCSHRRAEDEEEAWEKSISKWELMKAGYHPTGEVDTCGLCNVYYERLCGKTS